MAKRTTPAVAASAAVAAGGAIAAGKVVRDRIRERRRARRYRLRADESPREGIARIAQGQIDLAIGALEGREGAGGAEAIHEARKAIKRLRAVLRLSRRFLADDQYRQENTILRDAGRSLSGVRDAHVLVETLDGLRERFADELPDGAWSRFRGALTDEATALAELEGDGGAHAGVVVALAGVRARAPVWGLPREGGPDRLAPGLRRIYSRAWRARRRAAADPSPERLHELRKRTKDVWHAAQLMDPMCPKRLRKLARRAHRLADRLGDDHDLAVLLERAAARPELFAPGELELLNESIGRRRDALAAKVDKRAARLYRRKPRRLVRSLAPA